MSRPRIYVFRPHRRGSPCAGSAFAEDGELLCSFVSSSFTWFQADMGLRGPYGNGAYRHDVYARKYPYGYELVQVVGWDELGKCVVVGKICG